MPATNSQQLSDLFASETLSDKARQLHLARRWGEAEDLYKQAIEKRQKAVGADDPGVAEIEKDLSTLYFQCGRFEQAETLLSEAIKVLEKAYYADHGRIAPVLDVLVRLYCAQGKYADAEPIAKRAQEIYAKTLLPEHWLHLEGALTLAGIYRRLGKPAEGETILKKLLKQVETPLGPAGEFQLELAQIYEAQAKTDEAEKAYNLAGREFTQRAKFQKLAQCLELYAQFLSSIDRKEDSGKVARQASMVREAASGEDDASRVFPATLLRA